VKIALGNDHAGYNLKRQIADHLAGAGHEVADLGTDSDAPVDYPSYCAAVGREVVEGRADAGIVFGGSGQGEQIAANKVHGVRAALCQTELMARLARAHNDANVLALGERVVTVGFARAIVDEFLSTPFEGGRHSRRIAQIRALEQEECGRRAAGTSEKGPKR
jgi:ribose 5-phosphate isomerase B